MAKFKAKKTATKEPANLHKTNQKNDSALNKNPKKAGLRVRLSQTQSTSKSGQTPIHKFAVPVSELKKSNLNSSKSFQTAVKKKTFSKKQTKNWKVLSQSTQDYVIDCLQTGEGFIISKATNEGLRINYIQDRLTETVQRIKDELKTLKAPTKTYGDIKKITQIQKITSEQLKTLTDHEEVLEEVVREEEKSVRLLEKELRKLQSVSADENEIHPFLCNFQPELNIPPISYR